MLYIFTVAPAIKVRIPATENVTTSLLKLAVSVIILPRHRTVRHKQVDTEHRRLWMVGVIACSSTESANVTSSGLVAVLSVSLVS